MIGRHRKLRALVGTATLSLFAACGGGGGGSDDEVKIVPLGETWDGIGYEELTGAWWNWAASSPSDINPVTDATGDFADVGQDGPVWFLAGTFGDYAERTVTIPAGKAVFFPLINFALWVPEDGPDLGDLQSDAEDYVLHHTTYLECVIDGEPVGDPYAFRAHLDEFSLDIPIGSLFTDFGYDPGVRSSCADGYWIFLEPLPPGHHTIYFKAEGDAFGPFTTEVLYDVFVE